MMASTPAAGNLPGRIFISYRREDTAYPAGWLYDRLAGHFARSQVFKDPDPSIELGDDFVEVLTTAVASCDVLVVLIGDRWLTVTGQDGRRCLDNPDNFVRVAIEAALAHDVRVIPILVEGARMPDAEELPASLSKLARRQALELSPSPFDVDTGRLLRVLERTIKEAQIPREYVAREDTDRQAREQLQYAKPEAREQQETGDQIEREADVAAASGAEAQAEGETRDPGNSASADQLFLCYRREDTQGFARGIYESLASKYGHEQVFRDIDSTPAGVKYSTWIESRVAQCSVMIALIGNAWSSAKHPRGQRRLDLPKDWVRQEIEAALRRDIPIIPVRVQGAPMPSEDELPPSIAELTGFQSAEVTDSRWAYDLGRLIQEIDNLIASD